MFSLTSAKYSENDIAQLLITRLSMTHFKSTS